MAGTAPKRHTCHYPLSVRAEETAIAGLYLLRPAPFHDERGFFTRTFDADVIASLGLDPGSFVQDSQSRSERGTLRGLHFRLDGLERKLVRVARGAVLDVVVDLRPYSPTFRAWESFRLDDESHESLVIPAGCAHGFQVLSETADVCYRMDARYAPEFDATLYYADPTIGVQWPEPPTVLSARDAAGESFDVLLPTLMASFHPQSRTSSATNAAGDGRDS
jgi:dTDP-4-dehydrorhamnose 3,5-epimerase